jgi:hypothetical protein
LNREIKISFLDKVTRPNTGNKSVDGLLTVFAIPLYPIILLFGLVVMVFVALLSLCQRLTTSNADLQKQKQEILEAEIQGKNGTFLLRQIVFILNNNLQVRYLGTVATISI